MLVVLQENPPQEIVLFLFYQNSRTITRLVTFAFGKHPVSPLNKHRFI